MSAYRGTDVATLVRPVAGNPAQPTRTSAATGAASIVTWIWAPSEGVESASALS